MTTVYGIVDYGQTLREWDGFGVNYVETAQTVDYAAAPQDYGGFSRLRPEQREAILDLIFGDDGLQPGLVKMFQDPFHQPEVPPTPSSCPLISRNGFDHDTTTRWMRHFVKGGLARTRARGGDLKVVTTLYGPPAWMTEQRCMRGRDLDRAYLLDCAKYMAAWAKQLRETDGIPVRYISLHNEGEDYVRWAPDGANWDEGHDYNCHWSPELVAAFMPMLREVLDANGLTDVGVTPGECTNWMRFADWGYADAIAADRKALAAVGLITSHGFWGSDIGTRWFGDHRSAGIDRLRELRPELRAWTTSTSWAKMDVGFIYELRNAIYSAKLNGIIPWACIQNHSTWKRGDPNPGCAVLVNDDGTYTVQPGYHFYRQVSRVGQPGMAVARANATSGEAALLAFAGNGTGHPDALVVLNMAEEPRTVEVRVHGTSATTFTGYRTSETERCAALAEPLLVDGGRVRYDAPARSVTTFQAV